MHPGITSRAVSSKRLAWGDRHFEKSSAVDFFTATDRGIAPYLQEGKGSEGLLGTTDLKKTEVVLWHQTIEGSWFGHDA